MPDQGEQDLGTTEGGGQHLATASPSAKLLLDTIRWEFDADDHRHQSLILRATVLLSVSVTVLALLYTGVSLVLSSHAALAHVARFLVIFLTIMTAGVIVLSGIFSTMAMKTSLMVVPKPRSLLDSRRYSTDEDVVARDLAGAYQGMVESHRDATEGIAKKVNRAAILLSSALALVGMLVVLVTLGRR
ncbi:MAG: hypothetical protein ACYCZM_12140 [Acidimicrobiales bacterium]